MTINVYERYYAAEAEFNGVPRHGALVMLVATSEEGNIRYEVAVTFFPHNDEEDYAVSYEAKGRRSKKREQTLMETFEQEIDQLAETIGGKVLWEQPLQEARVG